MLVRAALKRSWTLSHTAATAAAAAGIAASLIVAPNAQGIAGAGLAIIMAAIAAIDSRYFIIPDELNIAALVLALVANAAQNSGSAAEAIGLAILRGAVLSLIFLGLQTAYRTLRKREGLGLGDVKLAGVAGAWLGWQTIPIVVEIAAFAALAAYAIHRYVSRRSFCATHRLPFGLFFAPAIWLGWLLETMGLLSS
jgi:leader peptidase (prepilin peptidase) / N-methyltransferase